MPSWKQSLFKFSIPLATRPLLLFTSWTKVAKRAEIWNCLSELLCTNCPNYTLVKK